MTERLDTLATELKKQDMESIFVTSRANFYYLSNYDTDPHERLIAVYVSTYHDPLLIIPAMEKDDAKAAGWNYGILGYADHENPWQLFLDYLKRNNAVPRTIGIENNHITMERYQQLRTIIPDAALKDAQELLATMRVIKSKKEYTLLKEAAAMADFAVETGVKAIREGVSEMEIIAAIEYEMKKQGIQEMAFSTMTLSGVKTASPHGNPSMKQVEKGDLVLFDLGVNFEGYHSDMTRTVAYKSISSEQERIYNTVLQAQLNAIEASKTGTAVGQIDLAARNYIEKAGYGQYFTHRIGHGLGIETHEYPSINSNNELPLQAGMCYTIEPGIYVPGAGGVRIEDMIFMTEKGAETLTKYPKELQIIE